MGQLALTGPVERHRTACWPLASPVEPVLAEPGQLLAAFPQDEGLLEGQAAGLQALDHRGELVPGLLVAERLWSFRGLGVRAIRHDPNPIRRHRHPRPAR